MGLLVLAGGASAQEDIEQRLAELLNERNREDMHPGNPLKLVGAEQEGNSFRDQTPALLNGDIVAAYVDPEANRARRLAMYDSPSRVDRALSVTRLVGASPVRRYQPALESAEEPSIVLPEEASEPSLLLRILGGVGAVLGLLAIKRRLG